MSAEPMQIPSVLLHPGVFERITESDWDWLYGIRVYRLHDASGEERAGLKKWLEEVAGGPHPDSSPRRSLMTKQEADALLTFSGTAWFLGQATGLELERVARICRFGMPWPLVDWRIHLYMTNSVPWVNYYRPHSVLTAEQVEHLQQIFEPQRESVSKTHGELAGVEYLDHPLGTPSRVARSPEVDELEYYIRMGRLLGVEPEEARHLCPPPPDVSYDDELPAGFAPHEKARAKWALLADLTGEPVSAVHQVARGLCCYLDCLFVYLRRCRLVPG